MAQAKSISREAFQNRVDYFTFCLFTSLSVALELIALELNGMYLVIG